MRFKFGANHIEYLRQNYHVMKARDIAQQIGCSESLVHKEARKLGVRKLPAVPHQIYWGKPQLPNSPNLFFLLNKNNSRYYVDDRAGFLDIGFLQHTKACPYIREDAKASHLFVWGLLLPTLSNDEWRRGLSSGLQYGRGVEPVALPPSSHDKNMITLWAKHEEIRDLLAKDVSTSALADKYGVAYQVMNRFVEKLKHLGPQTQRK